MSTKAHKAMWDALSAIVEGGALRSYHASNTDALHRDAVKALDLAAEERAEREAPTGHPNEHGHQLELKAHGSYQLAVVTIAWDDENHPGEPAYAVELRDGLGKDLGCVTTSFPGRAGFEMAKDRAYACIELLALLDEL